MNGGRNPTRRRDDTWSGTERRLNPDAARFRDDPKHLRSRRQRSPTHPEELGPGQRGNANGTEQNQVRIHVVAQTLPKVWRQCSQNRHEGVLIRVKRSQGRTKASGKRGEPKKLANESFQVPDGAFSGRRHPCVRRWVTFAGSKQTVTQVKSICHQSKQRPEPAGIEGE